MTEYEQVVRDAIKAEEECVEPNKRMLMALRKQLVDAQKPRVIRLDKPCEKPTDPFCARAFFVNHPILRALCAGVSFVRQAPADAFMPDAMRWTIYDSATVTYRIQMTSLEAK